MTVFLTPIHLIDINYSSWICAYESGESLMALRKCPECGHEMSTDADSCPNCGWKTTATKVGEAGQAMQGCGIVMTVFVTIPIILIFVFMGL